MVRTVRRIAVYTMVVEGVGTIVLFFRFLAQSSLGTALWQAIFHSVSAFNNCGMDLFGNFRSLGGYQKDSLLLLTFAVLFTLGSVRYIVVDNVIRRRNFIRFSLDSKLVLTTTLSLLIAGTIFILFAEFSNLATLGRISLPQKLVVAFFQSATRTAGFTAVDIAKMAESSLFLIIFLMFVGGDTGSSAGGIKVNAFGVLIATVWSSITGKENPGIFGREFSHQNIDRALTLAIVYLGLTAIVVVALSITEGFGFTSLLFETFSALGNVGLSMGITPGLSVAGRLIIIGCMFTGRLGPLALIFALMQRQEPARYHYPKDNIRIG